MGKEYERGEDTDEWPSAEKKKKRNPKIRRTRESIPRKLVRGSGSSGSGGGGNGGGSGTARGRRNSAVCRFSSCCC